MRVSVRNLFSGRGLIRATEFLALIPATLLLAPFLLYGALGMVIAMAGVFLTPGLSNHRMAALLPMIFLLAQMLVGCASLACLWKLLLGGMHVVQRKPLWRWLTILLLAFGLADADYFLLADREVTKALIASTWTILLWTAILVLPMLLGIRFIYLLLFRNPQTRTGVTIAGLLMLSGCGVTPIEREGAPQQQSVHQAYPTGLPDIRNAVLEKFGKSRRTLPMPFREMRVFELRPPQYPADWLGTYVDPGGFLESYRRIDGSQRLQDLFIDDATGDLYWPSEYATASGPVKFHCGLILHFAEVSRNATEVEVFEKVPTVWAGETWGFSRHGVGFGKFHDIRFVEPTVKDRADTLHLLDGILSGRGGAGQPGR